MPPAEEPTPLAARLLLSAAILMLTACLVLSIGAGLVALFLAR